MPIWHRGGVKIHYEEAGSGPPLLMQDTQAGGETERLYRSMGWIELGVMPGHALHLDGTYRDTVFSWKQV